MRRGSGQAVKVFHGEMARAVRTPYMDHRVQRDQGNRKVGRMRCGAMVADAQDGIARVQAVDGRAAAVRGALVAGGIEHAEVGTAHALKQVAADAGHVSQLGRGAFDQRLGDHRVEPANVGMRGDIGHAGQRADDQLVALHADMVQRQRVDVYQLRGLFHVLAHQVHQRGAAGDEAGPGRGRRQRFGFRAGFLQCERDHGSILPPTSAIAATTPGYAPQRQMLPLIQKRTSSAEAA
ncbi:hypothetical protein D3C72_1306100 [compost metagenome]